MLNPEIKKLEHSRSLGEYTITWFLLIYNKYNVGQWMWHLHLTNEQKLYVWVRSSMFKFDKDSYNGVRAMNYSLVKVCAE